MAIGMDDLGRRHDELAQRSAELRSAWGLADQLYAGFADYRRRAAGAGRTIPLLRLAAVA